MPFDLDWKGDDIPNQLAEPFWQANELLGRAFTREIVTPKWNWPSGESPRDIKDLGQLQASQKGDRGTDGGDLVFDHSWPVDYAMAVHEGAVLANGTVLPGRPWTDEPLQNRVLQNAFDKLANARLQ